MRKYKILITVLSVLLAPVIAYAVVQSLNGQSGQTQTFSNDTNLTITSVSNIHTLGWQGVLPISRGGTGIGSLTAGSILFAGTSSVSQDNLNLFWDNTNKNLGVGTNTPTSKLTVAGTVESTTGGFKFPDGTTQTTAATVPMPGVRDGHNILELYLENYFAGKQTPNRDLFFDGFSDSTKAGTLSNTTIDTTNKKLIFGGSANVEALLLLVAAEVEKEKTLDT